MRKMRSVIIVLLIILLVIGGIFVWTRTQWNDSEIIVAVMSIVVTLVLGIVTFVQTTVQTSLDKLDKTPFYELCFPYLSGDIYQKIYCRNCIPIIRIGNDAFVDIELKNTSSVPVASVEVQIKNDDLTLDMKSAGSKFDQITEQERKIDKFRSFLEEASEEEIGNGLSIFEKWCEIDTGMNSNYDKRVRELILHFFYYYGPDFNSDLTPYRDEKTNNEERKKILGRVVDKGMQNETSFYDYYRENSDAIIYHLKDGILDRTENKNRIQDAARYEKLGIDTNFVVNTERFHYYIPFVNWRAGKESVEIEMRLLIKTMYGYEYEQKIELKIADKEKIKLADLPDENDIDALRQKVKTDEYREEKRFYLYDKKELDQAIKKRGKVYVESVVMKTK